MKKIVLLSFGLLWTTCLIFGQKIPQNNSNNLFPQPQIENLATGIGVEYFQKNFISVESIASGNWNEPGVWNCGCVPTVGDEVHVMPGHEVVINQDISITSLFIDTTATVSTIISSEIIFNITGDWINNGEFNPNTSQVIFSGFDNQSISGMTNFEVLSLQNDREVNILSPVTVYSLLAISDAQINTNNQLTLAYWEGATAEIAPIFSGSINGDIIVESFIELAIAGWFPTAGPVATATLEDWDDDFLTTGFLGSDFPDFNFINISYFSETAGYVSVENITDEVLPGAGYFIYENAGAFLYNIEGEAVIGDFEFPVTYTDDIPVDDRGWNLLGNPYVATLNWNNTDGWEKNNMSGALYILDETLNSYEVFLNGYSVNGGSPIIEPFDNFFVLANENPSLIINEAAKQVGSYVPETPENNFFKFQLNGDGFADDIIIVMDDASTNDFELEKDAVREFNNVSTEIITRTADLRTVCINSMPYNTDGIDIPLIINSPAGGTMNLDILNIPVGMTSCLALENIETGEIYNLEETSSITFTIPPTDAEEIFVLHIGGSVAALKTDVICNADQNGEITATGSGDGPWDYYWYDENSNLIVSELESTEPSTISDLEPGNYTVIIGNLDFCTALTQIVEIMEPTVLNLVSDVTQPACNLLNSGGITSMAFGGTSDYNYMWNTGSVTETISDLSGGVYEITVTDANGCQTTESITIENAIVIDAVFDIAGILPMAGGQNEVTFNNFTENGVTYFWDFGDSSIDSQENPTHIYDEPGQYVVSLTAYNGACATNYNYVINIEESTVSIDELTSNEEVVVISQNGNFSLQFNYSTQQDVEVSIHNLLGQQLSLTKKRVENDVLDLEIPLGKKQVYFVAITNRNNQTKKIFKLIK